jgi:hypothetical protein
MNVPQREVSITIAELIMKVVQPIYQVTDEALDIGSWSRGTNTDEQPDIDLLFPGIPNDPQRGFVDWTPLDTLSMLHTREGITQLSTIQALDPILFTTITQSLQQMETIGWHAHFLSVRAWEDGPEVVFTISVNHPHYGPIGVDITLSYVKETFGIEHSQRFQHYLEQTSQNFGEERARQLIEDIRRFKRAVKKEVMQTGKLDRTKKVQGFVIEALFMHQTEPHNYKEVLTMLTKHTWANGQEPELQEHLHDQEDQLIEAKASFDDVLRSVTKGGYATLKIAASKELEEMSFLDNKEI